MRTLRSTRVGVLAYGLALVLLMIAPAGFAQSQMTPEEQKRLGELLRLGNEAHDRGDFEDVCAKYGEALQLVQLPAMYYRFAECNEKLGMRVAGGPDYADAIGRYRLAVGNYTLFVETDPEAKVKDRVKVEIARLNEEIERLLALQDRATYALVSVESTPPGAQITAGDGEIWGAAPLSEPRRLEPGTYVLRANLEGYEPEEQTVEVTGGADIPVVFTLTPIKEAEIVEVETIVEVPREATWVTWAGWTLVGLGAAAAGLGALELSAAVDEADAANAILLDRRANNRSAHHNAVKKAEDSTFVGWLGIGGSIVAIATGGAMVWWDATQTETVEATEVGVSANERGVGGHVRFSF